MTLTTGSLALLRQFLALSDRDQQLRLFRPDNEPARPVASPYNMESTARLLPVRFPKQSCACPVSLCGRSATSRIDLAAKKLAE
jgi:hypothetical protein